MESFLLRVLEKIKPSSSEVKETLSFTEKVMKTAEKESPDFVEVMLVGSIAKGTWLSGGKDIDVFLIFPKDKLEDIEKNTLPVLENIAEALGASFRKKYTQHPYLFLEKGDFKIDLVPAAKGSPGELHTAVDRTPHHTEYVRKALKDPDQVLLLKKFTKGIGVYGADNIHCGFSGYALEALVVRFGGFREVLKKAQNWKPPVKLDKAGFSAPLVFLDPVDPERNLTASVSLDSLKTFIRASQDFFEKPSEKFFFPPEKKLHEFEKEKMSVVSFEKLETEEDYGRARHLFNVIQNILKDKGFETENARLFENKFVFSFGEKELPEYESHKGPPVKFEKHAAKFRESYDNVFEKEGSLYTKRKREFRTADELIKDVIKKRDFPEKMEIVDVEKTKDKDILIDCGITFNSLYPWMW